MTIVKMDNNGFELIITYSEILLICFESKVSETEILSKILEQLDINNQMFTIFSLEELLFMLKYLDFSCVIALYFVSFFYEHPVYIHENGSEGFILNFSQYFMNFQNEAVEKINPSLKQH